MLRRLFRALVKLVLVGAAGAAVSKLFQRRQLEPLAPVATGPWPPLDVKTPAPTPPPEPAVVEDVVVDDAVSWVEPDDGECPGSHAIKAKLSSGVFHLPGMANYDRTKADRCYPDAATAETDGLRQAKR